MIDVISGILGGFCVLVVCVWVYRLGLDHGDKFGYKRGLHDGDAVGYKRGVHDATNGLAEVHDLSERIRNRGSRVVQDIEEIDRGRQA